MVKCTIEIDLPQEYEVTGEFREPKEDEYFISNTNKVIQVGNPPAWFGYRVIVRRKEVWRAPLEQPPHPDKGKRCRMRDLSEKDWCSGVFHGMRGTYFAVIRDGESVSRDWIQCQVLES